MGIGSILMEIKIEAIEEGWTLNIDIADTTLKILSILGADTENYHCWSEKRVFKGTGHKDKLDEMIGEFRRWMGEVSTKLGYVEFTLRG